MPDDLGIIGQVIAKQQRFSVSNPSKNTLTNLLVDMKTSLPIMTIPVIVEMEDKKYGAYKVVRAIY